MKPLFNPEVILNSQHRYFHNSGDEYLGFSKLYDTFMHKPFDVEMAALGSAKSEGVSVQEIKDRWDKQRDEGIRIDDAIDYYSKTGFVLPENEDIKEGILEVMKPYEDYDKSYGQVILYSKKYKVAGKPDRLSTISNRVNCPIVMSDFKCFEKPISHIPSSTRFLNAPFNHLANTKYTKIAFQLSFYSYLFEEITGRVPIRQFIHWIDPRTMKVAEDGVLRLKQELIPVPYMKSDIILFLETYKERIIDLTKTEDISAW